MRHITLHPKFAVEKEESPGEEIATAFTSGIAQGIGIIFVFSAGAFFFIRALRRQFQKSSLLTRWILGDFFKPS